VKAILSMVAASTIAVSAAARGQMPPPFQPPRIVTSGAGQARATPDRATVLVGVQTRALTAAVAGSDNARLQKAILDTLKSLGIPSSQLTTQNYSVSPQMRYDPNGSNPKVTGYIVSNTVRVELKGLDQVGIVIDAALAKGANQIAGIQFSVSNAAEVRRLALADALQNARADAEALARAAGGTLGALIEMSSSSPVYRPMMVQAQTAMAMSPVAPSPTPIEAGEQVITASVSAIWQFIPG
jgi:uncharacterized protein YggE